MQRATIADVARHAGVSTATVSRALSGGRKVSSDVAERVREAARELGYEVNPIARALRVSRTDTVGMVVPSIRNPFFTALVESVEHALGADGKELLLCDAQSDPATEAKRLDALVTRNVDGIIVSPCHGTDSTPAVQRTAERLPLVQLDRFVGGTSTDWVGVDDVAAMRAVVEHVRDGGARSAAYLGARLTNSSSELRHAGFLRHTDELGVETGPQWTLLGDYSVEWGEHAVGLLADSGRLPDALVCADDLIALGAVRACRTRGITVPDRIQVTGFDNIEFTRLAEPPLTTVDQPTRRIADEAVRLLADAAGGPAARDAAHVALVPKLVVRDSTRTG